MVTLSELTQANERGEDARAQNSHAVSARYDRRIGRVVIKLDTGMEIAFSPHMAEEIQNARPADLDMIEITPSGLGIHFPKINADLYLPALLTGLWGSKHWMAANRKISA